MRMRQTTWITTFGATAIIAALGILTSIVLARSLGPEGRGALLAIVFWSILLLSIFYLSLNEATTYHVARARADGKEGDCELECRSALTLHLLMAGGVTAISLPLLPLALGAERASYLPLALSFAAVFTPLTILDLYFNAVRQGRGDVRNFNILRLCQPLVYAAGLIALILFQSLRIDTVLATTLFATGVSVLLGLYFEGARIPGWNFPAMLELLRTGLRIHGVNLLVCIAAEADKLIVLRWMDDASAGLYAVALGVSMLGSGLVVQTLIVLAYPKISTTADRGQQVALICRFTHAAMLLLLLINGAAAAVAPWAIPLLFGEAFAAAVPVAMILLLANTFRGVRQVMDRALRATLHTRLNMLSEGAGLISFIAAAPIGASMGGLVGIAWAMAAAQALAFAVMVAGTARLHALPILDLWGLKPSSVSQLMQVAVREFGAIQERSPR